MTADWLKSESGPAKRVSILFGVRRYLPSRGLPLPPVSPGMSILGTFPIAGPGP